MSEELYRRATHAAAKRAGLVVGNRCGGIGVFKCEAASIRMTGWLCNTWRAAFSMVRDIARGEV